MYTPFCYYDSHQHFMVSAPTSPTPPYQGGNYPGKLTGMMERYVTLKRSMSSSEVRMTPRPPKTPAWSIPPLMTSPMDDPSSCSDNASDNSDKIESLCSHQQPASSSSSSKNRKRKFGNNNNGNGSGFNSYHNGPQCNGGSGNGGSNGPCKTEVHSGNNSSQVGHGSLWSEAESLAADFDGSLSGLGADLSTASYDMSEALLALPSLYHHHRNNNNAGSSSTQPTSNSVTGFLKEAGLTPLSAAHLHGGSSVSLPGDFQFDNHPPSPPPHQSSSISNNSGSNAPASLDCERRFQYVLAAATSIATKMNEETLTYLNQGQPYEIKLKKLGELTAYRGVVFRSIVRLCFHDRRLQFSEKEQIVQWEDAHPNDRILHVDLPLSYGVTMVPSQNDSPTNTVQFLWEPLKEVGLYVKVNCISTEFTPKKHGGEKGVPFRMMIETYSHPDNVRLHAAACQVKVFKLKGADRKHKQDREKILKKTPGEQAKLQPSYECTVLSDISLESLDSSPPPSTSVQNHSQQHNNNNSSNNNTNHHGHVGILSPAYSSDHGPGGESPENPGTSSTLCNGLLANGTYNHYSNYFSAHFSPEAVRRWLIRNRFSSTKTLWDYSGIDLLRLSKEEFIEVCGLAEGIRLYNALHYKITFYVTLSDSHQESHGGNNIDNHNNSDPDGVGNSSTLYHPVCLSSPSITELTSVLSSLFHSNSSHSHVTSSTEQFLPIERLFLSVHPPGNVRIRVLLTEQLLSTLKDQSAFRATKNGIDACLEIVEH